MDKNWINLHTLPSFYIRQKVNPHLALDMNYRQRSQLNVTNAIGSTSEEHNTQDDGILFERLGDFDGVVDAIENSIVEEEDSMSLFRNNEGIENEDIGSFLDNLPWDLIRLGEGRGEDKLKIFVYNTYQ